MLVIVRAVTLIGALTIDQQTQIVAGASKVPEFQQQFVSGAMPQSPTASVGLCNVPEVFDLLEFAFPRLASTGLFY